MTKRINLDYVDTILNSLQNGVSSGATIHKRRNLAQKIQLDRDEYEQAIRNGNDSAIDKCSNNVEKSTREATSFLGRLFGR